jgi:hypothetical protein
MLSTPSVPHTLRRALAASLAAAACGGSAPTAPDAWFPLATDRSSYNASPVPGAGVRQYEFTVVARLRNASAAPLYFESCGASAVLVYGVELVDGGDQDGSAYDPAWSCPGGPPLALAAGAERADTLRLWGPNGFVGGRGLGALSGRMRIVYGARTCPGAGACGPEAATEAVTVRSSAFTVAAAP